MFSTGEIMTSLLEIQYGGVCGSRCQVSRVTHPFRLLWCCFAFVDAIIYLLRATCLGTNTSPCPISVRFVGLTSWVLDFIRCFRSILRVNSKTKTMRHRRKICALVMPSGDLIIPEYFDSFSFNLMEGDPRLVCRYRDNRQLLFAQPLRTTC